MDALRQCQEADARHAPFWLEQSGEGPLLAIDAPARAREEDPHTDYWARVVPTWLVPTQSRFEVDLNRERSESVYARPEMAWDLDLWRHPLPPDLVERSHQEYDDFYRELRRLLDGLARRYAHLVVLDLHSYNHRRRGPDAAPSDPNANPEVNVGTGSLDRERFGALVDRFIADLAAFDFLGRHLDVREDVKFRGRQLARWIHREYPGRVATLSIEFKKFYMDEWTGVGDVEQITAIRAALAGTVPGLLEELDVLDVHEANQ